MSGCGSCGGIEEKFRIEVSGREMLAHSTIEMLAGHLAGKMDGGKTAG